MPILKQQNKSSIIPKKKELIDQRRVILSRHPSHDPLRKQLPVLPFKYVVRLGSTTDIKDTITNKGNRIELNTIEGVKNSSSKLLMKQRFTEVGVRTADWFTTNGQTWIQKNNQMTTMNLPDLPYPIIAKSLYGSRGEGNSKLDTKEQLEVWLKGKTLSNYIFEKFYSYNKEYRLHITKEGCFYTCRKMLKSDTAAEDKWHRHDSNSVWILEENEMFDTPFSWKLIIEDCVKALKALKLDICCFDVKVQSNQDSKGKNRELVEWIIIESGSAPSFGDITTQKYLEQIPKLLQIKYNESK